MPLPSRLPNICNRRPRPTVPSPDLPRDPRDHAGVLRDAMVSNWHRDIEICES